MASDFPYLYPYSRTEARHRKETQRHEDSFRLNVSCARAIEQAIREHFNEEGEKLDVECAQSVLEQYGFKRVSFVLTNSLKEFQKSECKHLVSEETYQWGQGIQIPADGKYNRYFVVDTAAALLEGFIRQTRDAYQALELFGPEHCVGSRDDQNYEGKVLVLSPAVLREGCWTPGTSSGWDSTGLAVPPPPAVGWSMPPAWMTARRPAGTDPILWAFWTSSSCPTGLWRSWRNCGLLSRNRAADLLWAA